MRIYLKIFIAFILIFIILLVFFFSSLKSLQDRNNTRAGKILTTGILTTLEKKLIQTHKSQWENILQKFRKKFERRISIIPIKDLRLKPNQISKLNRGNIIFETGQNIQFLNYGIVDSFAYKQIGALPYVLIYAYGTTPKLLVQSLSQDVESNISQQLLDTPKHLWPKKILELEKTYGFPITVFDANTITLPNSILTMLNVEKVAYSKTSLDNRINTIYFLLNNEYILKLGPLDYLPITGTISDIQYYFLFMVFLLGIGAITTFTLLFLRNLRKIYQLTQHYSHGNFNYHITFSSSSVLNDLHTNITAMGRQLQQLIEGNQKLCRFVAHETRTPLSTLQMALDNVLQNSTKNEVIQNDLKSMQDDIDNLNELVKAFLLYSQYAN